jgi:hypothetical protein
MGQLGERWWGVGCSELSCSKSLHVQGVRCKGVIEVRLNLLGVESNAASIVALSITVDGLKI